MNSKLLLTTLLICIVGMLSAQTIYVQPSGTGNGTSWSNATDIQSALQSATVGSSIWVKEGVYKPVTCSPCTQQQREISFEIPTGIQVYGGFDGTETAFNQRNFNTNITIFSADTDNDGTTENNSNTVVYFRDVSNQTILDGFTIKDGRADFSNTGDVSKRRRGGGIYNDGSLSGGSSTPIIRNCIIENNYAVGQGGGLYNNAIFSGNASPIVEDCIFRNNVSELGGAMFNDAREGNCLPTFTRCQFIENQAFATGGAVYSFARLTSGFANPKFVNCLFRANTAHSSGAVYSLGVANGNVVTEITNSTFVGNNANIGGAVYVNASDGGDCSTDISNCVFWQNFAGFDDIFHYSGNGDPVIHLRNSLVEIANCDDLLLGVGSIDCQGGIIYNQDPLFVNSTGFDYRLTEASPCINVGNNGDITEETTDLDGSQRVQGGVVDMGCYEFGGNINLPLTITQQPQNQAGCEGQSTIFSVSATGTQPLTYQWQKNNINIVGETLNSLTINDLSNTDVANYQCIVTDVNGENLTSQNASMAVAPIVVPAVSIAADNLEVCAGESIIFTAVPTNGGTSGIPFYIWQVNGSNVNGENTPAFILENSNGNEAVQVTMISTETCAAPTSAFSEVLLVTTPPDAPSPTITISTESEEICLGETVFFNSNISNGGDNPIYVWRLNGAIVSMTDTYSTDQLESGNAVICELTVTDECGTEMTTVSNSQMVNVQTPVTPQITIQASNVVACVGGEMTFFVTVQNAGDNPVYDWRVNGASVAVGNEYTANSLIDGDLVTCLMMSSQGCLTNAEAISNVIPVVILPTANPEIAIAASGTEVCEGGSIVFNATVIDGGTSPIITWFVNGEMFVNEGLELTISDINIFTSVQVQMQTSAPCPTSILAFSETVGIDVLAGVTPTVTIAGEETEFCNSDDLNAVFTASANFPPAIYVWSVNGMEVQSSPENILNLTNFEMGDAVTCRTISEGECLTNIEANSDEIILTVFELPVVSLSAFDTICSNGDLLLLDGGVPFGGEYSGDFVEEEFFDAVAADVGIHAVSYFYTDENNCTNIAEEQIEVVFCTDINDIKITDVEVFPNPFTNQIQVFAKDILRVEMRNVEGKLVSTSSQIFADNAFIEVEKTVAGIYFLRVLTENGVGVSILVKE